MKLSVTFESEEVKMRRAIRALDEIVVLSHREDALNAPLSPLEKILGFKEPKRRRKPLTVFDFYQDAARDKTGRKSRQKTRNPGACCL